MHDIFRDDDHAIHEEIALHKAGTIKLVAIVVTHFWARRRAELVYKILQAHGLEQDIQVWVDRTVPENGSPEHCRLFDFQNTHFPRSTFGVPLMYQTALEKRMNLLAKLVYDGLATATDTTELTELLKEAKIPCGSFLTPDKSKAFRPVIPEWNPSFLKGYERFLAMTPPVPDDRLFDAHVELLKCLESGAAAHHTWIVQSPVHLVATVLTAFKKKYATTAIWRHICRGLHLIVMGGGFNGLDTLARRPSPTTWPWLTRRLLLMLFFVLAFSTSLVWHNLVSGWYWCLQLFIAVVTTWLWWSKRRAPLIIRKQEQDERMGFNFGICPRWTEMLLQLGYEIRMTVVSSQLIRDWQLAYGPHEYNIIQTRAKEVSSSTSSLRGALLQALANQWTLTDKIQVTDILKPLADPFTVALSFAMLYKTIPIDLRFNHQVLDASNNYMTAIGVWTSYPLSKQHPVANIHLVTDLMVPYHGASASATRVPATHLRQVLLDHFLQLFAKC
jgi:hypothetical protein